MKFFTKHLRSFYEVTNKKSALQITSNMRYSLIHILSIQLILMALILTIHTLILQFWLIVVLLIIGIVLAVLNQIFLKKKRNTYLSGHFLILNTFLVISLTYFWVGGLSSSYLAWYLILPMIGGAILGIRGLVIYASLSLICIFFFILFEPMSIYKVPPNYLTEIELFNFITILFLEVTLLYSILYENLKFSSELIEQNFLLQADQKKFHYLARHDNLTNLPNRTFFNAYLENLLSSVNVQTHSVTLLFMDLDHFKYINDTYGHHAGDHVLLKCSKRLQHCLRNNDFIARIGGDEFVATIVHNKNDGVPDNFAKRILQEFNKPFFIDNTKVTCHLSLGAASYPSDATSLEVLLKKADKAMYEMKMKNRSREN
ncbi:MULTISPECIES: GGDEF domain-containing protein [Legionella]|uniref:GGDEF domain-containing protein n=1 Tax=Legionella resiliens TaxID=2905958 RepID=A0ABS8WZ69_9GAMM|nr:MULTISPECIES: GGDEF domain-containing protein [unclassified Legionella]MCE0721883.1 GGDEF domain-containing protein [Legionella sp. 9fVS26]MCE3531037.1 GGDEF domain-containing protein [Legionella sp. 8cVS16]QLZ70601.1 hypothetical protein FOLKNPGA_03415 [Legionella sp. PC1000]